MSFFQPDVINNLPCPTRYLIDNQAKNACPDEHVPGIISLNPNRSRMIQETKSYIIIIN